MPPEPFGTLIGELALAEHWATVVLAAISILVFAEELAIGGVANAGLLRGVPTSVLFRFGAMSTGFEKTEPYRALAGCFVHMGVLHLGMNLLALAELGRVVEPRLRGPRTIVAYTVTGIAGFAVSAWWYGTDPYITAGGSGAIFGLDGVLIASLAMRGDRSWRESLVRTVVHSFAFYFVLHTNQAAHLGGLAAGLALGVVFAREARPWRHELAFRIAAAAMLAASVASIALATRSPLWKRQEAIERQFQPDDAF